MLRRGSEESKPGDKRMVLVISLGKRDTGYSQRNESR